MNADLRRAAAVIAQGGVVLHATEGVWGFACDVFSQTAVQRILQIKERPSDKGLIVIGHQAQVFERELAELDANTRARIEASWPGAVTWVLPSERFPQWATGGRSSIAARVPGHEQARALAAEVGGPLVSTSANRSGEPALVTEQQAHDEFSSEVDMILSGAVLNPGAASLLQTLDGTVLRP